MSDRIRAMSPDDELAAANQLARYLDAMASGEPPESVPPLSPELDELATIARALAADREPAPESVHSALRKMITAQPEWAALREQPSAIGPIALDRSVRVEPQPFDRPITRPRSGRNWWPYLEAAALIAAVFVVLYVALGRNHQAAVTTPTPAASPQASPSRAAGAVGDCPVEGCSPSRSAPSDRAVGATAPNQLWKIVLTPGVRGLVASGSHLYATDGATLYALDLNTGVEHWRASLGVPAGIAGASPPVVSAGVVYIAASDGTVFAFSAAEGKTLWSHALREPVVTSVAVEGGLVYAGTVPGHLHALNAATGDEAWEFATGPIKNSSPVIVDGVVYIGGDDNQLFALEAATGKQLWRREVGAGMKSVAVGANLALVASRGTGAFVSFTALSTTDASQVWLKPLTIDLTPAIVGQTVYVSEDGAIIAALDSQTGAERWRFSTTLSVVDLAVTSDTALVLRKDGAAIALDNRTGTERWRVATGLNATSIAVGAGVFYAAHKDGTVTAYGTPSP